MKGLEGCIRLFWRIQQDTVGLHSFIAAELQEDLSQSQPWGYGSERIRSLIDARYGAALSQWFPPA